VLYISRGSLSSFRWCVVFSFLSTRLSWNAHPAASPASISFLFCVPGRCAGRRHWRELVAEPLDAARLEALGAALHRVE
jgi:hypothetical protein